MFICSSTSAMPLLMDLLFQMRIVSLSSLPSTRVFAESVRRQDEDVVDVGSDAEEDEEEANFWDKDPSTLIKGSAHRV